MMGIPNPRQIEAAKIIADGRIYPDFVREQDGWHARWLPIGEVSNAGIASLVDAFMRRMLVTPLTASAESSRHQTLHDAWIAALRSNTGKVAWDDRDCEEFSRVLTGWHGRGADWRAVRKGIVFRFAASESKVWCDVPLGREGLRELGFAPMSFAPLRGMRPDGDGRLSVELQRDEAELFLKSGSRRLVDAGYSVEGVDLSVEVTASADLLAGRCSADGDDVCRVQLTIRVAGEKVSAEEIRFLLEQNSSLVFFRNRWIEVDRNILKQALKALEMAGQCELARNEALAFASGIGRVGTLDMHEVASHGWLRGLVESLRRNVSSGNGGAKNVLGRDFIGTLRDYQLRGTIWMKFLVEHGFGALLADDMGLGKTVQTIAWMSMDRHDRNDPESGPVLVVAPLTLLSNWSHELARFVPSYRVYVHQGASRSSTIGFASAVHGQDVVLTSYNLLVKEFSAFAAIQWRALVLDEAQTIKNPKTVVAKAVKALAVKRRIALTGTPVENSVADIWSIEEFLNPGFLGDAKTFAERFAKPLAANPQSVLAARLSHALEPFVLRRLKSEPGIAAELGEKREIREYCQLSERARLEYEEALAEFHSSEHSHGDVFALLTRLKITCDGAGKFERLVEIAEQVIAAGESILVFTQYAKIGVNLSRRLGDRLKCKVWLLHGGLSTAQREREIRGFSESNEPSVFVLSLRVGGFGLNLTKATHVVHYDRWWNPAVENQATDRAHRIGQNRTVFVHLMITAGTVEEHVDEMLERKSVLSGGVVKSGEGFLAQLPLDVLERTVRLDE